MKNKFKAILLFGGIMLLSLSLSGQTWSPRQRLSWNAGNSSYSRMAVTSGNRIHLTWHDYTFYRSEILYKDSTDRGDTWQPITRITWDPSYSKLCDIKGHDNSVYLVWAEYYTNYEIVFKRGNILTSTWDAIKRVTWNSGDSSFPSICRSTKTLGMTEYILIHIVWEDDTSGNKEIYYKKGTYILTKPVAMFSWSPQKRLTWNSGDSSRPVICTDSNKDLHVVWYDNTPGNHEIYYKGSTDEGNSWSGLKRLTWTSDTSFDHDVTIDSADRIHVVWYDGPDGNRSPYHKKSTDGGLNWTGRTRIMWNTSTAVSTSIASDSVNNLHVVYVDDHTGTDEIYYKTSTNGGLNWSAPLQLTWNTISQNFNPNIMVDNSDGIHVVWDGPVIFPPGPGLTHEIFYKNKK